MSFSHLQSTNPKMNPRPQASASAARERKGSALRGASSEHNDLKGSVLCGAVMEPNRFTENHTHLHDPRQHKRRNSTVKSWTENVLEIKWLPGQTILKLRILTWEMSF